VPDANGPENRLTRTLGQLMPILERGGPVLSLALLVLGALIIYYGVGEWRAQQQTTRDLVERLLKCTEALGQRLPCP
jgi:hypothetical protein